jgi:hypothetical protein
VNVELILNPFQWPEAGLFASGPCLPLFQGFLPASAGFQVSAAGI